MRAAVESAGAWVVALLLTLLGLLAAAPARASDGVVSADTAPVFEAAATTSAIVAILDRGDRVAVRFSLGVSPAWCRVETLDGAVTGYTPCAHVQLESGAAGSWRGRGKMPPTPAPSLRSVEPSVAMEIAMNKYNIAFWARWLGFSEEQMLRARALARRTGVSECRARIAAWYRRHGLDDGSHEDPAARFTRALRDLPSVARGGRCDVARLWRDFPAIMTPGQRGEFETWQRERDVPILTRSPLDPTLEWFE
jgi:hypothetical protein